MGAMLEARKSWDNQYKDVVEDGEQNETETTESQQIATRSHIIYVNRSR